MPDASPRAMRERILVLVVLALSLATLALQALVLRPRQWPAGAGFTVSGDTVFGELAEPRPIAVIRPPNVLDAAGRPAQVMRVTAGGPAERAGVAVGDLVTGLTGEGGRRIDLAGGLPADPEAVLDIWREADHARGAAALTLDRSATIDPAAGSPVPGRSVTLARDAIWSADRHTWWLWLQQHLGPLSQVSAFLAGALVLVALGARGSTASMITLALIATAVANGGPLHGAEDTLGGLGSVLLLFNWLATPLSFPVIGFAVLYFPHRAEILDRHRWIVPAILAAALPMLVISITTAAFLLGLDAARPLVAWFAVRPWTFSASFAVALAANVALVVEGIGRYRTNFDADERRRMQVVVFTGVPAVFAYAIKTAAPMLGAALGRPFELPWPIAAFLQAVVLLPAFGLPYAVAVKHMFSPRTVLRRSLQYAFARRTLTVLVALPALALVASIISQSDRSISMIVRGQPLFYLICVALIALGLKYRVTAQRWLDRRFFRTEYDAREILVSLASRVPYETDPQALIGLVVSQIDSALSPEALTILADEGPAFQVVKAVRREVGPLDAGCGLITLLRWSDRALEVFLDDEQSPVTRLPAADRAWLESAQAALLVPIFAGGSDPRPLVGVITLGAKRSEEPYTTEDRQLLSGIASQMGVALDLSRLRRQVGTPSAPGPVRGTPTSTPTQPPPSPGSGPGIGVGTVVEGKYRVDALIGRGGMGAVFRARDLNLARDVAIKIVRAELVSDRESRERFRREAQIVARLQHPAIVTIHDFGSLPDGAAYLVMEYVRGEDLRGLLRREGKLSPDRLARLMEGIAAGVDAAHKTGVFHRDLKPENILLPEGSGPKVLDFGVAKMTDASMTGGGTLTGIGTIVGTPAYMSPEQLRGEWVDGRSDVFSLGVMSYEILTGATPYGSGSFIDIAMKHASGDAVIEMVGIPPALRRVIRRAVAFDREARMATALELAREISESVGGPRLQPRPAPD